MLRAYDLIRNRTLPQRDHSKEGLLVRATRPEDMNRHRSPLPAQNKAKGRCTIDLVSDLSANGHQFQLLNIVSNFHREYVANAVEFPSTTGQSSMAV